MQMVPKKSGGESLASKSATAKAPSIAFDPVPDTLTALHVISETGLTRAEADARHAPIRAFAGIGFAMGVRAVIGRLPRFVAVA
jgi:hypothetical protein